MRKAFAVLHPLAGRCDVRTVRRLLRDSFAQAGWPHELYETTGLEKLPGVVRDAVARGFDVVIVAGGDGTVSGVAEGLVGSDVPMGILPVGTGNVLARELWIPMNSDRALGLIRGEHGLSSVDAMKVGEEYYFLNVSAGFAPLMIRDTKIEHKRIFGVAAYLYNGFLRLAGFQPRRFKLEIDGKQEVFWASEVVIANSGILARRPFNLGTEIRVNDGKLDICIIKARTVFDYLGLLVSIVMRLHRYDRNIEYLDVKERALIGSDEKLVVQADGEVIGETPLEVVLVPSAVKVISPLRRPNFRERFEKFMSRIGNGKIGSGIAGSGR